MTTFRRFCEYVDAAREVRAKVPRDASYGRFVAALADAGFVGATARELTTLADHLRGMTETRRERNVLLKETIELMKKHGIRDPEFGADAISGIVLADDIRAQTVQHDLRQFEADVREAARRLGKAVPRMRNCDAQVAADNVFAWVYALNAGLLPSNGP
jgi:hypothetical protein